MGLKNIIRKGLNLLGFDVIRLHQVPKRTLLGLSRHNIGTIIDVGANEGQFARTAAKIFPRAELYCFEPLEDPFRKLSAWAQSQNGRVRCFQMALGDQEGEAEMHLHVQHTPSSSLLASTATCHRLYPQTQVESLTRVRVSTLDEALKDALDRMPRELLLKLDVQGFEDRVLRGGGGVRFPSVGPCSWRSALIPFMKGRQTFTRSRNCFTQPVFAILEISIRLMVRMGEWFSWMRCLCDELKNGKHVVS